MSSIMTRNVYRVKDAYSYNWYVLATSPTQAEYTWRDAQSEFAGREILSIELVSRNGFARCPKEGPDLRG